MTKTETSTHWRTIMNTRFLNGDELPKDGIVVKIDGYSNEQFYSPKSKEKEDHVILSFDKFKKPMILTNRKAKQISKALDTPMMDKWIGKTICIVPVQEKHFGEWFPVINIKPGDLKKEVLNSKHKNWDAACDALKNGKTKIESIEKHYTLTKAIKAELEKFIPS